MASDVPAGATQVSSQAPSTATPLTRALLGCGLVVGPLYLGLGLAQALIRDGFDLARHPLSALANGTGGWVQTLNLALSGILVIAAAVGFGRALGLGMIVAAAFPMDAVDGFPVGTPEGLPTSISTSGIVHFAAAGVGFLALAVGCFFMAAAMRRRAQPALARFSRVAGIVIPVAFVGGTMFPGAGIIGIWLSVITQFVWIGVMAWHLRRAAAADFAA